MTTHAGRGGSRRNGGGAAVPRPSLSVYFTASRLRTDGWEKLKTTTYRLASAAERGGETAALGRTVAELIDTLVPLEVYFAYPGWRAVAELRRCLDDEDYDTLFRAVAGIVRRMVSRTYRSRPGAGGFELARTGPAAAASQAAAQSDEAAAAERERERPAGGGQVRPYFTVLFVDAITLREEEELHDELRRLCSEDDEFVYDNVLVRSFEDALIAVLLNPTIQSVVIRYGFPFRSPNRVGLLERTLEGIDRERFDAMSDGEVGVLLGGAIKQIRPELDLFLVTDAPVEDLAGNLHGHFRRVFYRQEDYRELHLSIQKGIRERYNAPFFTALKAYAQKPTGVFHALPISRAKSIARSLWIRDMEQFYGPNVFLAETSATTAGLDSLLQPHGSLREAQALAARAFGARRSYFVTNGTSTANKIVLQALVGPGDLVLTARDCHQSHHYALVLAGAMPVYLDPYALPRYAMFGAVPLREIKKKLLDLRRAGKLDRVKVLLMTNCTFDGIVMNPERVMEEVLAIKPDIAFVWDEAWFAFATFAPITRRRTAMASANRLREKLKSPAFRQRYARFKASGVGARPDDDAAWLEAELVPDPERARVRVYATHSTHKTLTSLRQGSMIHVNDQDFDRRVAIAFHQAYLTHTSTSANYQILASLDVGRRQVELEGYELVQKATELALTLRERVNHNPDLARFFRMLTPEDLIPREFRPSGFKSYRELKTNWALMDRAWEQDEFCLDPTRLTLGIGTTGIGGDAFKRRLIEEFDIQINKTSPNTVLFMTHIGTTRGAAAYLIDVLTRIADELVERREEENDRDRELREDRVAHFTERLPPLPPFSRFHRAFRADPGSRTPEGDLRAAFFLASEDARCEYLKLDGAIQQALRAGREVVAAAFITPYPPGFPLLVPGQSVSPEILAYLKALDVTEIHGYEPLHGLRIFKQQALDGYERELGRAADMAEADEAEADAPEASGAAAPEPVEPASAEAGR